MAALDILPVLVLVAVIVGGSTYVVSMPIRREVARAVRRGEPLPRVVGWWEAVAARGHLLLGVGGIVLLGGAALWYAGRSWGMTAALVGLVIVSYYLQAVFIMRLVRKEMRAAAGQTPQRPAEKG